MNAYDASEAAELDFLGDRYTDVAALGEGAFGKVYRAYDQVLKKAVAVKVLSNEQCKDSKVLRFQQEARLASRLRHINVVTVLDFGVSADGRLYLIMDLVEGRSLEEVVEQDGPLSVEAALRVCVQICDGLEHAHGLGVVHRDIKPSNIMLIEKDLIHEVRIVDFGLAKVGQTDLSITATGDMIGTPLYTSPEQIRGESVDNRSDIYSLACTMVKALTGVPPYYGATALETYNLHVQAPYPSLRELNRNLSEDVEVLDAILAKALAKQKEDRYASISEFKEDLIELLPDLGLELRTLSEQTKERDFGAQFGLLAAPRQAPLKATAWVAALFAVMAIVSSYFLYQNSVASNDVEIIETMIPDYPAIHKSPRFFLEMEKHGRKFWTYSECTMVDSEMKALEDKKVVNLRIPTMTIYGDGLKFLVKQPIKMLNIMGTRLNDENLHYIGEMKQLEELELSETTITDEGFATISQLPELRILELEFCPNLGDDAIKHIVSICPNLEELDVSKTRVGKDGLSKLKKLSKLKEVSLKYLNLTDSDVAILASIRGLKSIDLSGNSRLTDACVTRLQRSPTLRRLEVVACENISQDAVENFKTSKHGRSVISQEAKKDPKKVDDVIKLLVRDVEL
ncbi:MAG: protein kinase [Candidatus Obscuribacterales bacterium]|nr:protein kinase [Candidatus Obscuribacterales bacterium]